MVAWVTTEGQSYSEPVHIHAQERPGPIIVTQNTVRQEAVVDSFLHIHAWYGAKRPGALSQNVVAYSLPLSLSLSLSSFSISLSLSLSLSRLLDRILSLSLSLSLHLSLSLTLSLSLSHISLSFFLCLSLSLYFSLARCPPLSIA